MTKKRTKGKQNLKASKNSKQAVKNSKSLPKNSKSPSVNPKLITENPKPAHENSKSLPECPKSVLVNPTLPPSSLELIDPAIIFTPDRKKENLNTLVSIYQLFKNKFLILDITLKTNFACRLLRPKNFSPCSQNDIVHQKHLS